jgi:hypothetical protein
METREMTLTDDDLEQFLAKDHCDECGIPNREKDDIMALVARLEAAENVIKHVEKDFDSYTYNDLIKAWRKAKGE